MPGLLSNQPNPLLNIGMGLLSQGPSRYPINPWQGVQRGLLQTQYDRSAQAQAQQEAEQFRMQQEQHRMAVEQQKQAQADAARTRALDVLKQHHISKGDYAQAFPQLAAQAALNPKERNAQNWLTGPNGESMLATDEETNVLLANGWKKRPNDPAAVVNVGQKGLTVNDALKMVDAKGNHPQPGISADQAHAQGFRLESTAAQTGARKIETAENVLTQLDRLSEPVFGNVKSGLSNRIQSGIDKGRERLNQADTSVEEYVSFAEGTVAPLIKSLGESGNLATEDVERGLAMLPKVYPIPDTKEVAKKKLANLAELIRSAKGGPSTAMGVSKISTDADYNALPSGTEFIDPEGNKRRKP